MRAVKQSVYLQIVDDVKRKIELGLLREGEKLPSCRELALEMGVNPNTVQRAYSELELGGYIYTQPKKGVYVCPQNLQQNTEKIAREKLAELKTAGIPLERLIEILKEIYGGNDD